MLPTKNNGTVVDKFGGIDVLINNVGGSLRSKGPVETLDSDELLSLLQLNVISVYIVSSTVCFTEQCWKMEAESSTFRLEQAKSDSQTVPFIVHPSLLLRALLHRWQKNYEMKVSL